MHARTHAQTHTRLKGLCVVVSEMSHFALHMKTFHLLWIAVELQLQM